MSDLRYALAGRAPDYHRVYQGARLLGYVWLEDDAGGWSAATPGKHQIEATDLPTREDAGAFLQAAPLERAITEALAGGDPLSTPQLARRLMRATRRATSGPDATVSALRPVLAAMAKAGQIRLGRHARPPLARWRIA